MTFTANKRASRLFRETADLLNLQGADPLRIQAYLQGAKHLDKLTTDIREMRRIGGREALEAIPDISPSLATSIEEILDTGHMRALDRLKGHLDTAQLFRDLPGVGETLAQRIHDDLHLETLEELELAARDGRLAGVRGIGPKRAQVIATYLSDFLQRAAEEEEGGAEWEIREKKTAHPPVPLLLSIDEDYRKQAEQGSLALIAPRRFNPLGRSSLPIAHHSREGWWFTTMYSNNARAHALGKTRDWVVIHAEKAGREYEYTVETEMQGELQGLRIIRELEDECRRLYACRLPEEYGSVHLLAANNNE